MNTAISNSVLRAGIDTSRTVLRTVIVIAWWVGGQIGECNDTSQAQKVAPVFIDQHGIFTDSADSGKLAQMFQAHSSPYCPVVDKEGGNRGNGKG